MTHTRRTVLASALLIDSVAVIGCNGIDADHGVTNLNLPEAEIKQRMIAAADRTVVVADGSKLGQVHLGRIGSIRDVDTVVTGDVHAHHLRRTRLQDVLVAIRAHAALEACEPERRGNRECALIPPDRATARFTSPNSASAPCGSTATCSKPTAALAPRPSTGRSSP